MSSPNSKVKTLTVLICGHCSFKPLCPQRANREKILPQQVKTAKHILTITFHFIFNSLNTKLDLGFFHTVNNLVLIYAPLILPLQERSYTLQLHITPKFFPTMNTKIGLLKKKKKHGELAHCMFMSTFRKHGNMQPQLTRRITTCDQTIL